jgi:long-chain-fatty-acid--CoA ligase ACSBG
MLSHDNITWTTTRMTQDYLELNQADRIVSYLPLSHIAAQLIDIYVPLTVGAAVYFAQLDALKGSLVTTLREVQPTVMFGVPRMWEKIQETMTQKIRQSSRLRRLVLAWATAIGAKKSKRNQFGRQLGTPLGYRFAKTFVLSVIHHALGLDKCKACFSAAAPISVDTLNFFASLDIPVYEVYGISECTGPHTVSSPGKWKIGSCGRALLGSESKIDPGTGELSCRGRHIFMGYMYMPEESASAIDVDGWFHSGDTADLDSDGFMKITGRLKDLIITAGGENVSPVLIVSAMRAAMEAISHCVVVGDKKKYLAMLITLKTEIDPATGAPTDVLAKDSLTVAQRIGSSALTVGDVANDPLWTAYFNEGMNLGNSKSTSKAQEVRKWRLLQLDLSEAAGDVTPTLKVKRNVVLKRYQALIDSIYAEDE